MKRVVLKSIIIYQKTVSPVLSLLNPGYGCRFFPSCSSYGYQAIQKYGLCKGLILTLKRIIKCNPFHKGGIDPC